MQTLARNFGISFKRVAVAAAALIGGFALSNAAFASPHGHGGHVSVHFAAPVVRPVLTPVVQHGFNHHHHHHAGYWHHGWHGPRFGWWWVAGPAWTWYAQPTYGYAAPVSVYEPIPAAVQTLPAPTSALGTWYYCDSSKAYYPHVTSCATQWREVPATLQ